jgi:RNA polymerase sigma-70 factor (ECF subfamily)
MADVVALPSRPAAVRTAADARPGRASRPDRAERRMARGLRRGDERALEDLYRAYGPATFGYLQRALGDRAAAEDVQQQVFTEVWRRGPDYDPARSSLLTWVMTITRSRAIDHLRRRVPEPQDPADAERLLGAADDPGHDELAERWRLAALLARLPAEERALLRLRFQGGFSQSEIAERAGIPLGTVKTRMVRGLDRLREALEAEDAR